jgi:hypothetical protein
MATALVVVLGVGAAATFILTLIRPGVGKYPERPRGHSCKGTSVPTISAAGIKPRVDRGASPSTGLDRVSPRRERLRSEPGARPRYARERRASITRSRVLEALDRVDLAEFIPIDVALALLPELADTTIHGRQAVINRVGDQLRRLAEDGELARRKAHDSRLGRATYRYSRKRD